MKLSITKTVHIGLDDISNNENTKFSFFDCDMSEYGYVVLGEQEISIEIPDDFNPIPLKVRAIENEKRKIQLDCETKIIALNEKIQKLLCIEAPKQEESNG